MKCGDGRRTVKGGRDRKTLVRRSGKKSKKSVKELAGILRRGLKRLYPDAACALVHVDPYQLMVATILSAQCTDARVNEVTPRLFSKFPDVRAMARADVKEVERIIKPVGLYKNKAKNIVACCREIVKRFGGEVPAEMEDLMSLPGIGRKTANVILGNAFGIDSGIAVDTHVARLSRRMGLTEQKDPLKIERDLLVLFPRRDWVFLNHALIAHGRSVCKAVSPRCGECFFRKHCRFFLGMKHRL